MMNHGTACTNQMFFRGDILLVRSSYYLYNSTIKYERTPVENAWSFRRHTAKKNRKYHALVLDVHGV